MRGKKSRNDELLDTGDVESCDEGGALVAEDTVVVAAVEEAVAVEGTVDAEDTVRDTAEDTVVVAAVEDAAVSENAIGDASAEDNVVVAAVEDAAVYEDAAVVAAVVSEGGEVAVVSADGAVDKSQLGVYNRRLKITPRLAERKNAKEEKEVFHDGHRVTRSMKSK